MIWTYVLQLVIMLAPTVLKMFGVSEEDKQRFWEWIRKASEKNSSVDMMRKADEQLEYLKKNPWKPT